MRPQKIIATVMLVMSATLMAATSHDIAYPGVLCLLGLVGLQRRLTWDLKPSQRVVQSWLLLVVAIVLAAHYRWSSPHIWMGQEQAITLAWQTVARYFLAAMVLMLFLGAPAQLPPSLGMFHIAITICAGQILLLDDRLIWFRGLEFFSVILVVLYAATAAASDRRRAEHRVQAAARPLLAARLRSSALTAALILVIAANVGWIFGSLLYRHVEVLNYVPLWLARQGKLLDQMTTVVTSVGFTTSGRLSSMQTVLQDQDATAALTIDSRNAPGYLRARAFDWYRSSEWHDRSASAMETLGPSGSNPMSMALGGRTYLFRLDDADYPDLDYMTIRHKAVFQGAAFTPPGTVTLEISQPWLQTDDDGIVYTQGVPVDRGYRLAHSPRAFRREPTGMQLHWFKDLPNQVDPNVTLLAGRIFAGCTTTEEKIEAVIRHFRDNYTYSLSIDIPEGRDKLTYFLLSGSSGYCEYFASGAALLLRFAGVPTRYVTGFFVTQKDDRGDLWVARNMDAHAWAEAWDEERRCWTIVEATVQGGANTTPVDDRPAQADSSFTARLRRLAEAVYEYGFLGLIGWLLTSYGLFTGSLVLSVLLGCTLWWLLIRWRRHHTPAASDRSMPSPAVIAMHRMLARMDRRVKAMGLRRDPSETLPAFAARLTTLRFGDAGATRPAEDARRAAAWYLHYAGLRYARSIPPEQLRRLRQSARWKSNRR